MDCDSRHGCENDQMRKSFHGRFLSWGWDMPDKIKDRFPDLKVDSLMDFSPLQAAAKNDAQSLRIVHGGHESGISRLRPGVRWQPRMLSGIPLMVIWHMLDFVEYY
jgi:hypothetical protein